MLKKYIFFKNTIICSTTGLFFCVVPQSLLLPSRYFGFSTVIHRNIIRQDKSRHSLSHYYLSTSTWAQLGTGSSNNNCNYESLLYTTNRKRYRKWV